MKTAFQTAAFQMTAFQTADVSTILFQNRWRQLFLTSPWLNTQHSEFEHLQKPSN